MMFKKKGGGVKGIFNNVQKTALLVADGFPYKQARKWETASRWGETWPRNEQRNKLILWLCKEYVGVCRRFLFFFQNTLSRMFSISVSLQTTSSFVHCIDGSGRDHLLLHSYPPFQTSGYITNSMGYKLPCFLMLCWGNLDFACFDNFWFASQMI